MSKSITHKGRIRRTKACANDNYACVDYNLISMDK